jgi:hypothetical protein
MLNGKALNLDLNAERSGRQGQEVKTCHTEKEFAGAARIEEWHLNFYVSAGSRED